MDPAHQTPLQPGVLFPPAFNHDGTPHLLNGGIPNPPPFSPSPPPYDGDSPPPRSTPSPGPPTPPPDIYEIESTSAWYPTTTPRQPPRPLPPGLDRVSRSPPGPYTSPHPPTLVRPSKHRGNITAPPNSGVGTARLLPRPSRRSKGLRTPPRGEAIPPATQPTLTIATPGVSPCLARAPGSKLHSTVPRGEAFPLATQEPIYHTQLTTTAPRGGVFPSKTKQGTGPAPRGEAFPPPPLPTHHPSDFARRKNPRHRDAPSEEPEGRTDRVNERESEYTSARSMREESANP